MCVVTFVQIRLQQQRDLLQFPKKFAIKYKVNGTQVRERESTKLNIVEELILYGSPNTKIKNDTFHITEVVEVDCFMKIHSFHGIGFHTLSLVSDNEKVVTATTVTNKVGHVYLKHRFLHLNPTFFITYTFDGYMDRVTHGNSSISGFVEIRNLPIILNKEIGLKWIKV